MPPDLPNCCLVVPHYDHVEEFQRILPAIVRSGLPLFVVDDASPEASRLRLRALLEHEAPEAHLVIHESNLGKGGSVISGLKAARAAGFSHALQIDADGQHDLQSLPLLLQETLAYPDQLICGLPKFGSDISGLRYYARFITLYLCWLETLSTEIRDALCGFRAYPLESTLQIIDHSRVGHRMAFDPEILVRACWAGLRLRFIAVNVNYPPGGRSHFRYFQDNLEIGWMHARLLFGMLARLPLLLGRKLYRRKGSVSS